MRVAVVAADAGRAEVNDRTRLEPTNIAAIHTESTPRRCVVRVLSNIRRLNAQTGAPLRSAATMRRASTVVLNRSTEVTRARPELR
jgi:hypothetical protein